MTIFVALAGLGVLAFGGVGGGSEPGLTTAVARAATPPTLPGALEPPATGGAAALDRALARLATHKRLLVVAAHPDDEDTSLLALVSRGMGGEAAYLSLSRGEGGQNLIGPELGVGLGLIRSRELLSARAIDGARQYFSRAYDFGYTRSLEETFQRWPREVLHEDVARVIRRFRPQILVSIFPGQPVRTHGQHQAAGVVAHEIFDRVGEAGSFPELTEQGLPPWQPLALYRATWFAPESTTLELPLRPVDPATGKSIFQLAMASRSQHRSQDMGVLQPLGNRQSRLGWVGGVGGIEAEDLFAGVNTSLPALVATLPTAGAAGEARRRVEDHLTTAEAAARRARQGLVPARLAAVAPDVAEVLGALRAARYELRGLGAANASPGDPGVAREAAIIATLVDEKVGIAEEALAIASGVLVDAFTDGETWVAGEEGVVTTQVWNPAGGNVTLTRARVTTPEGWTVAPVPPAESDGPGFFGTEPDTTEPGPLAAGALYEGRFTLEPPADALPSVPYFLARPLRGDLYDWTGVPVEIQGEPFAPPPVIARFEMTLEGVSVTLEREVVARSRDQARGEIRRPLRLVPAVEVAVEPELLVWPVARERPQPLVITLTAHRAGLEGTTETSGQLHVAPPEGWPVPEPVPFTLREVGLPETFIVELAPPTGLAAGRHTVEVTAVLGTGERFQQAAPLVDYEHIRPTPRVEAARLEVAAADLELPALEAVGYVRGASDRVPEFLTTVGVPLTLLTPEDVGAQDLDAFDAIVVGSRAYESDPELARVNGKLLDYARRGGLLMVQYQQYQFARGGFAPFPLDISRPHDRITDETAPVTLLEPEHPVFHNPNTLDDVDWRGWVQERGLYFAGTWDDAYTPLLEMIDPGDDAEPVRGGLLVAPLGEGTYVYTGLAFFRQLPAGVPGAYRLFANLLALAVDDDGNEGEVSR